jgi:hypothetical protein
VRYGLEVYIRIISSNFRLQKAIFVILLKAIKILVIPVKVGTFMKGIKLLSLQAFRPRDCPTSNHIMLSAWRRLQFFFLDIQTLNPHIRLNQKNRNEALRSPFKPLTD